MWLRSWIWRVIGSLKGVHSLHLVPLLVHWRYTKIPHPPSYQTYNAIACFSPYWELCGWPFFLFLFFLSWFWRFAFLNLKSIMDKIMKRNSIDNFEYLSFYDIWYFTSSHWSTLIRSYVETWYLLVNLNKKSHAQVKLYY